jgi:hypothetical protein
VRSGGGPRDPTAPLALGAGPLHVRQGLGGVGGEDEGPPRVPDHHVVLDADPQPAEPLGGPAVVLGDVQTWGGGRRRALGSSYSRRGGR